MKKEKVIIDTDPGVDDATALILAFFDKKLDIQLISTVKGNVGVETSTRNVCHLEDLCGVNFPVAKGVKQSVSGYDEDAIFLHGQEGLGRYIPPKTTINQPISNDAVEEMRKIILKYPKEITIFLWGPHTNLGTLLIKYPELAKEIKKVIYMGGSLYDTPEMPEHISFNSRCDSEAFKIVLNSGIPLVMVPSYVGRFKVHLTEEQVEELSKLNDVGKLLATTYQTYWEPNVQDKRIATNDTGALFFLDYPRYFKTKRAYVFVDSKLENGRTYAKFSKRGNVEIVMNVNRKKFLNKFFARLKKLDYIKIDDKIYELSNKNNVNK